MGLDDNKKILQGNMKAKIVVGFIFVIMVILIFFAISIKGGNQNLAKALGRKNLLKSGWETYENLTKKSSNLLQKLSTEIENLNEINSENASSISFLGNDLKDLLVKIDDEKKKIQNSDSEQIKDFHIKLLNNLQLQKVYISNAIDSSTYFNCMVERKSNFNLNWEEFKNKHKEQKVIKIENINSPQTQNYFIEFSQTAEKSSKSLAIFTSCFEDKFYVYKDVNYDKTIDTSQDQLTYLSYLYKQFSILVTESGKETELIALIEKIEQFDLASLPFFKDDFNARFIVKPTKEVFKENVSLDFTATFAELEVEYKQIISEII